MSRLLGIENLRFIQGDILDLEHLDESFDVITSSGVLHHMREPQRGWRQLLGRLAPGGLMRIGLYSEIARKPIRQAREAVKVLGLGVSNADILEFRRLLLERELDEQWQADVSVLERSDDLYAVSGLRDLVFHVEEHQFSLLQLKAILDQLGLRFIGFELSDPFALPRYRSQFPDDAAGVDLENWHAFETRFPDTFIGMYQFWCQRRAIAAPVTPLGVKP